MKKTAFLVALLMLFKIDSFPCAAGEGLSKLVLNHQSYAEYYRKITYAQPLSLEQLEKEPDIFDKNLGKRVTILGFVEPEKPALFINHGKLVTLKIVNNDETDRHHGKKIAFQTSRNIQYKPYEVYQVTGILKKNMGDETTPYIIEAQFAEPQTDIPFYDRFPELKNEISSLPMFDWETLYNLRDPMGRLLIAEASAAPLPESIKKLENKKIRLEGWLADLTGKETGKIPASGSMFISMHNLMGGQCACCGSYSDYAYDNTARIILKETLSPEVKGGIFTGVLKINPVEERNDFGFFTLEDAILAQTLSLPDIPEPAPPKINSQKLLPALFIKPTAAVNGNEAADSENSRNESYSASASEAVEQPVTEQVKE
ncbi:MAG: hypothetical protein Kow0029_07120 [Candidatus Rifleibacteriota bacterium]